MSSARTYSSVLYVRMSPAQIVAAFDRSYDLDKPVELDELGGSAVVVLRNIGGA